MTSDSSTPGMKVFRRKSVTHHKFMTRDDEIVGVGE
jgi:hypothetical protein